MTVFAFTRRPKFAADVKARGQADDAMNSVCRNIAEGFGCRTHAEFATFLTYSRRSLNELIDAMRGAQLKGYVSAQELDPVHRLARRLYPALNRFIAYLRRTPDPPRNRRINKRTVDRTDIRQSERTDPRQLDRTDGRRPDRTDKRSARRTDAPKR